jgi:hypothetical protein
MGHFALGRLLRYFIQPLLRDTLYLKTATLPFRGDEQKLTVSLNDRFLRQFLRLCCTFCLDKL